MDTMEIVLLIAGVIIFILSFFIPDKNGAGGMSKALAEDEIKKLVNQEFEGIKVHVDEVVEEAVTYAIEKTERSLERLSNEKIMAVSEYSDTVLEEIHKNHEEAMFLYDMLNNKHTNLKDTVSEVNRTVKEAEEAVSGIRKFVPESVEEKETADGYGELAEVFGLKREAPAGSFSPLQSTVRKAEIENGEAVDFVPATGTALTAEQVKNNNEKILELYKKGLSTVEIAKELGLGVGEVGLVIGLYQNQ